MSRSSLALAALTAFATPLLAQTFPTPDPVIRRIYAVGMDSSATLLLAHVLFDSLGPRLTGSPDLKRAQDWLVQLYRSWGIAAREEQYGTWRSWRRGPSHIDLVAPRVRTLQGQMLAHSPGTGGRPVTLEAIVLPRVADSSEFAAWLPQARGKLVLISAGLPTCRPQDDWAVNAAPESKARMDRLMVDTQAEWDNARIGEPGISGANAGVRGTGYFSALGAGELGLRLEQGGAAGLISSRPKLRWTLGGGRTPEQVLEEALSPAASRRSYFGFERSLNTGWGATEIFETYNLRTPAVSLDCEDYGLVFRLAESGMRPRLRLTLDAQPLGEQPVFNVLAEIKGREKPDEYVMLSAHFDSWDGSSGATDNGTGSLTMLEAMRILRQAYPQPRRTILVGHWTGEEQGENGSKAFTEDHPEVLAGLQALFNQDDGTGRIRSLSGGGLVHSPEHITDWLGKLPVEFRAQVAFNGPGRPAGGGSDDFPFGCLGLPAFGMGATSWDYGNVTWHTDRDTYDKLVFDDLKYNATLTAMLVYLAAEDPERIPLDRVDAAALASSSGRRAAGWPVCEKAARRTNPRLR